MGSKLGKPGMLRRNFLAGAALLGAFGPGVIQPAESGGTPKKRFRAEGRAAGYRGTSISFLS